MTDAAVYAVRLMTEVTEREALAADLAVSETWFFRGGRPLFDRLAAFITDRAAGRSPGNTVRVLSAPCSTGEEPYSLAIALHERFLTPDDYVVDAVDMSERALARARAARYGTFAFREAGTDMRPAYFRRVDDQWELLSHLRAGVRFQSANFADPTCLATERAYDLILCRNLFIYLTPDARVRAAANLDRLLTLDGRLCVTPAEADRLPPGRFSADGSAEFGIYRRAGVGSTIHKVITPRPDAAPTATPPPTKSPLAPERSGSHPAPGTLEAARAFADSGQLGEARAVCEWLLRTRPTDADVLALLGVVHLAAGRGDDAFDAFPPEHAEAMAHMVGLCERRGDPTRAAALRRRLARLAPKEGA
jgi:chemotaxis protein methyltransferase WspC